MIKKKWTVTYLPEMLIMGKYWTKFGALRRIKDLAPWCGVKNLELTETILRMEAK